MVEGIETVISKNASRACELCRALKVRCIALESSSTGKCHRCVKSNKDCVFTAPSRTRRRRGADVRVTELEKEVRALSSFLKTSNPPVSASYLKVSDQDAVTAGRGESRGARALPVSPISSANDGQVVRDQMLPVNRHALTLSQNHGHTSAPEQRSGQNSFAEASTPSDPSFSTEAYLSNTLPLDVIDRGLISLSQACRLFERYLNDMVLHYPTVVFREGTLATTIRQTKPILFLAIIAAAAGTSDRALNDVLNEELSNIYAHQVIVKGKKSLELIQSILITVIWYYPCDSCKDLRFYQYAQMAATMALEIGLARPWKRFRNHTELSESLVQADAEAEDHGSVFNNDSSSLEIESLECRRTLLACYATCANLSLTSRRPNMLQYSDWISECVAFLENTAAAAPTDKKLATWVKLQRLVEEAGSSLGLDDPSHRVTLSELRTRMALKACGKRLRDWKEHLPSGIMDACLTINFEFHRICLHEVALYDGNDIEDFLPPFRVSRSMLKPANPHVALEPAYLDAVTVCVSSTHTLLETFLSMSIDTLRAIPIINYVRMSSGVFMLIKLFCSASDSENPLAQVLDPENMKLNEYLERLIPRLMATAKDGKCRAASKFLMVLMRLATWHYKRSMELGARNESSERAGPLINLGGDLRRQENAAPSNEPQEEEYAHGSGPGGAKNGFPAHNRNRKSQLSLISEETNYPAFPQASDSTQPSFPQSHPNFIDEMNPQHGNGHFERSGMNEYQWSSPFDPLAPDIAMPDFAHVPLFNESVDSEIEFNESLLTYMDQLGILTTQDLRDETLLQGGFMDL